MRRAIYSWLDIIGPIHRDFGEQDSSSVVSHEKSMKNLE